MQPQDPNQPTPPVEPTPTNEPPATQTPPQEPGYAAQTVVPQAAATQQKNGKKLALIGSIIGVVAVLAVVFVVFILPLITKPQLGSLRDETSGSLIYKLPSNLESDQSLKDAISTDSDFSKGWSLRDKNAPSDKNLLFAVVYDYQKFSVQADGKEIIGQFKELLTSTAPEQIKKSASCKDTPTITTKDSVAPSPAGVYYEFKCTTASGVDLQGVLGAFSGKDGSSELHPFLFLGRSDIWDANKATIDQMVSGIRA